jgi:hypothetical protein
VQPFETASQILEIIEAKEPISVKGGGGGHKVLKNLEWKRKIFEIIMEY